MTEPISLHKHRISKLKQLVDNAIESADNEFSEVNDELIDFQVNKGEITLNDAVKTIWSLVESMDKLEQDIINLKLLILEGSEHNIIEEKQENIHIGYFDGSATPNPGEMVIGGVIRDISGNTVSTYSKQMGEGTNNQAEYLSLINLLKEAKENGIQKIHIKGDSLLVVNQVTGVWKAKNSEMKRLKFIVHELLKGFSKWSLKHVPREDNKEADRLT